MTAVRGIEDCSHLHSFFAAKNHKNLVLAVADVLELPLPTQQWLAEFLGRYLGAVGSWKEPRELFFKIAFDGFLIAPLKPLLLAASMVEIKELQQVVMKYHDLRLGKGEPSRIENCECGGKRGCRKCGGEGRIITYLEVGDRESVLAERDFDAAK